MNGEPQIISWEKIAFNFVVVVVVVFSWVQVRVCVCVFLNYYVYNMCINTYM